MKHCVNRMCRDVVGPSGRELLCPACRHLARWMFGLGFFVAGLLWGLYESF